MDEKLKEKALTELARNYKSAFIRFGKYFPKETAGEVVPMLVQAFFSLIYSWLRSSNQEEKIEEFIHNELFYFLTTVRGKDG